MSNTLTEQEECIHLLDPRWCTICNGHDRRVPDASTATDRRVGGPRTTEDTTIARRVVEEVARLEITSVESLAVELDLTYAQTLNALHYLEDEFDAVAHEKGDGIWWYESGGVERYAQRDRNRHPHWLFPKERGR